jgi:hypothetical protein
VRNVYYLRPYGLPCYKQDGQDGNLAATMSDFAEFAEGRGRAAARRAIDETDSNGPAVDRCDLASHVAAVDYSGRQRIRMVRWIVRKAALLSQSTDKFRRALEPCRPWWFGMSAHLLPR